MEMLWLKPWSHFPLRLWNTPPRKPALAYHSHARPVSNRAHAACARCAKRCACPRQARTRALTAQHTNARTCARASAHAHAPPACSLDFPAGAQARAHTQPPPPTHTRTRTLTRARAVWCTSRSGTWPAWPPAPRPPRTSPSSTPPCTTPPSARQPGERRGVLLRTVCVCVCVRARSFGPCVCVRLQTT